MRCAGIGIVKGSVGLRRENAHNYLSRHLAVHSCLSVLPLAAAATAGRCQLNSITEDDTRLAQSNRPHTVCKPSQLGAGSLGLCTELPRATAAALTQLAAFADRRLPRLDIAQAHHEQEQPCTITAQGCLMDAVGTAVADKHRSI